ncbi:hypothetical protein HLB35_00170 [Halomonas sp. TBZ9]|uniref:Uncharacterized protein n=1 Tax=Vreelandella azerica TaxID=2732867 RepID=A0A7Y3TUP7_9GAMM|nr:hypothetical protein [Halomonas azerica]NOG30576.1 hypothetical protein [Halomonas azerica]
MTDENGQLTRLFTDSADAVLWLTPSTSPGQVQELDDLKIELESGKPLLPVITRSDAREEDFDEEGTLYSILVNKTSENRKEQEQDVYCRAIDKLGKQKEVKTPSLYRCTHIKIQLILIVVCRKAVLLNWKIEWLTWLQKQQTISRARLDSRL